MIRPDFNPSSFDLPRQRIFVDEILWRKADWLDAVFHVFIAPIQPKILYGVIPVTEFSRNNANVNITPLMSPALDM